MLLPAHAAHYLSSVHSIDLALKLHIISIGSERAEGLETKILRDYAWWTSRSRFEAESELDRHHTHDAPPGPQLKHPNDLGPMLRKYGNSFKDVAVLLVGTMDIDMYDQWFLNDVVLGFLDNRLMITGSSYSLFSYNVA